MKTKYRFKTQEEFEKEYGPNWRRDVENHWISPVMDVLYGIDYPHDIIIYENIKSVRAGFNKWSVSMDMLTKKQESVPNYEPRKLIRDI